VTVRDTRIPAGSRHRLDFSLSSSLIEVPVPEAGGAPPLSLETADFSPARTMAATIQSLPVDTYRDVLTLQPGVVRVDDTMEPRGGWTPGSGNG
jgi:hypothetical protein